MAIVKESRGVRLAMHVWLPVATDRGVEGVLFELTKKGFLGGIAKKVTGHLDVKDICFAALLIKPVAALSKLASSRWMVAADSLMYVALLSLPEVRNVVILKDDVEIGSWYSTESW